MTHDYKSDDPASEATRDEYRRFVEEIRRNLDPHSNTVLIIDDERGIRRKVARDVKSCAPNVVIFEASNGQEGLEKLESIRAKYLRDPLLIVLDLNMPVMDGWTFIERMKEAYESSGKATGIPIVVLSSTSGEKGVLFTKKSVHGGKMGYTPLVTVAKETCTDAKRYDATGERGLVAWLEHFIRP